MSGRTQGWQRRNGLKYFLVNSLSLWSMARQLTMDFCLRDSISLGDGLGVLAAARTSLATGL